MKLESYANLRLSISLCAIKPHEYNHTTISNPRMYPAKTELNAVNTHTHTHTHKHNCEVFDFMREHQKCWKWIINLNNNNIKDFLSLSLSRSLHICVVVCMGLFTASHKLCAPDRVGQHTERGPTKNIRIWDRYFFYCYRRQTMKELHKRSMNKLYRHAVQFFCCIEKNLNKMDDAVEIHGDFVLNIRFKFNLYLMAAIAHTAQWIMNELQI